MCNWIVDSVICNSATLAVKLSTTRYTTRYLLNKADDDVDDDDRKLLHCVVSPQVNAKQPWILDYISVNLNSRFQSLVGFRIPIISRIPDSNH